MEDKVGPIKSTTCLGLVPFLPFQCCSAGSLQFSSQTEKYTKLFHSNVGDVFHFLGEIIVEKNFSQ